MRYVFVVDVFLEKEMAQRWTRVDRAPIFSFLKSLLCCNSGKIATSGKEQTNKQNTSRIFWFFVVMWLEYWSNWILLSYGCINVGVGVSQLLWQGFSKWCHFNPTMKQKIWRITGCMKRVPKYPKLTLTTIAFRKLEHAIGKNWPFGQENLFRPKAPQNGLFWWTRIWVTWLWKALDAKPLTPD